MIADPSAGRQRRNIGTHIRPRWPGCASCNKARPAERKLERRLQPWYSETSDLYSRRSTYLFVRPHFAAASVKSRFNRTIGIRTMPITRRFAWIVGGLGQRCRRSLLLLVLALSSIAANLCAQEYFTAPIDDKARANRTVAQTVCSRMPADLCCQQGKFDDYFQQLLFSVDDAHRAGQTRRTSASCGTTSSSCFSGSQRMPNCSTI